MTVLDLRYSTQEMIGIWSYEEKFRRWAEVEVAVLQARVNLGELSLNIPRDLVKKLVINVEEINRIEKQETGHDVIAFLMHTSPQLPPEIRPYWHNKMTSYDTQDTALSLIMINSVKQLQNGLMRVMEILKKRAFEFKNTPQIGRTHGVHAEPITFGVKLAKWHDELNRQYKRLEKLKTEVLSVGKISGAVGMYTLDPKIEKEALKLLGLNPIISTQIIPRDIHAEYLSVFAIISGSFTKFCTDIRTMQRTEIREVQEFFGEKQRGSSAMPHKKNPTKSEQLCGIAKKIRANAQVGFENQSTWDERDLTNSSAERLILSESSVLLDYMLNSFANIMENLKVFPKRMLKNLNLTKGLVFSQSVQALVADKSGLPREDAYKLVQVIALDCWEEDKDFLEELLKDEQIRRYITEDQLKRCFDLQEKLKFVDAIFEKIFGGNRNEQERTLCRKN